MWGYLVIVKRTLNRWTSRTGWIDSYCEQCSRGFFYLFTIALLTGCAGADVAVQSTRLPVPVVDPLPVSIGIHLSDELKTFAHEEAIRDFGTFRIAVGSAQDLMFNNLAQGLFANYRILSAAEAGIPEAAAETTEATAEASGATATPAALVPQAAGVDAILIPSIGELQFSIPAQTKSDFFEVWLNYNFKLVSSDGQDIASWPLQAYGRANSRNYGFLEDTENGALQEAARVALRDAMAVFTFKFQRVPGVQQWLQQQTGVTTANDSNSPGAGAGPSTALDNTTAPAAPPIINSNSSSDASPDTSSNSSSNEPNETKAQLGHYGGNE